MEEMFIAIPYIIVNLGDSREAALVKGALASKYYTKRTDELSFSLKIAGGMVVNNAHELRMAVEELETTVRKVTSLPCHTIEYGMLYLQPCQRRLLSGQISEHLHAYYTDANIADSIEIFFIAIDGDVSYLGKGTLTSENLAFLYYKREV